MADPIPVGKRRERNEMIRILSNKKKSIFYDQFLDQDKPVLLEHSKKDNTLSGFTDNYIKVEIEKTDQLCEGQIIQVKLLENKGSYMNAKHQL